MCVHRALPSEELFDRQLVAAANFLETDRALAHRVNNYCLALRDPTFGRGRRQVDACCEWREDPVLCRMRYVLAHENSIGSHAWEERDHFFQMCKQLSWGHSAASDRSIVTTAVVQ